MNRIVLLSAVLAFVACKPAEAPASATAPAPPPAAPITAAAEPAAETVRPWVRGDPQLKKVWNGQCEGLGSMTFGAANLAYLDSGGSINNKHSEEYRFAVRVCTEAAWAAFDGCRNDEISHLENSCSVTGRYIAEAISRGCMRARVRSSDALFKKCVDVWAPTGGEHARSACETQ